MGPLTVKRANPNRLSSFHRHRQRQRTRGTLRAAQAPLKAIELRSALRSRYALFEAVFACKQLQRSLSIQRLIICHATNFGDRWCKRLHELERACRSCHTGS
ncbi:hypothetical protein Nepgr_032969 [Nepenthes gracilis]|uniref:Uncharacterized protein n=1 Tax=Nepenthes gracilis TaxID=150966 RepID=A0AAD3Y8Q0_NEPGR|nr:hypothetical protein Nepgr_032969 [Nepenthes gracilis]